MSGIVGLVRFDGTPATREDLVPMLAAIEHRGPAQAQVWIDGAVALGCRLLRTTPESIDERQPVFDPAIGAAITADARIDNREDLVHELGLPADVADSGLILAAYGRWGRDCVSRLLGDFAFALWDARAQTLFCARDHFGLRPLFYCRTDRFFAFASEIDALLALPDVSRRIDEGHVLEFLVGYFEDLSSTLFRDIRKLLPAHVMASSAGGFTSSRYWSLEAPPMLRLRSDGEYAEAMGAVFREAVKCRVRSSVPVGSMLSGGLDSSSIACTARDILSDRGQILDTFSLAFDDVPASDEREYWQSVLATQGIRGHVIRGDRIGPLHEIEQVVRRVGGPFHGPNLFLHRAIYQAAQNAGVGVLLDGIDGDTTISHGMHGITEFARSGRWLKAIREARAVSLRFGKPTASVLRALVIAPLVPEVLRVARRRWRGQPAPLASIMVQLSAGFRARTQFEARAAGLLLHNQRPPRSEQDAHLQALSRGLLRRVVEIADGTAAAFSIEPRYPFFDRRLVEFCLSLPAEQKLRNGWSRWVMRRAMEGVLPAKVQWRGGKSDLSHNFARALYEFDREHLRTLLDAGRERIAEYVDVAAVNTRLDRFVSGQSAVDGQTVMQAAILAVALREFAL